MKGRICSPLFFCHGGLKKSPTINQVKNDFFRPVTSFPSGRQYSFPDPVAGFEQSIFTNHSTSVPATVPIFFLDFACGGLQSFQPFSLSRVVLAVRPLFQCHFVTEYIMTITNHVRRIQDLADQVIAHVDDRNYCAAHSALVDIEERVCLAHEHIDHLQDVTPRAPVPAVG